MSWKVLKTEDEYKTALKRTMEIFHPEEGSPEEEELELLLVLVKDYEDRNISVPEVDPIEVVKLKMKETGTRAKDLEPLLGSKGHVSSILRGRRELTLTTAKRLRDHFNISADVFMPSVKLSRPGNNVQEQESKKPHLIKK